MNANDSKSSSETNWERIDQLTEEEIDTSDIPPLNEAFFTTAELRLPDGKVMVSVDAEVLEWFKSQGPEYQNLINQALRTFVETHKT